MNKAFAYNSGMYGYILYIHTAHSNSLLTDWRLLGRRDSLSKPQKYLSAFAELHIVWKYVIAKMPVTFLQWPLTLSAGFCCCVFCCGWITSAHEQPYRHVCWDSISIAQGSRRTIRNMTLVLSVPGPLCFGGDGVVFDATPLLLPCGLSVLRNRLPMLVSLSSAA